MSTALIIVIAIAAIVVIALIAAMLRRNAAEREIEHERLSGEAVAHRDQADSNVAKARERATALLGRLNGTPIPLPLEPTDRRVVAG
jgi:hypothetical protein